MTDASRKIQTLSLTQPWASLIARGLKRVETRSWSTSYRGELAIHAAKGCPREARELAAALERRHGGFAGFPLGAVIATVKLVDIRRTQDVVDQLGEEERAYGNYAPGRFAWFLEDVKPLEDPIPAKGSLGLWLWTPPEEPVSCMCEFASTCGGLGVIQCSGCGGDLCVCGPCNGQGELDCEGCDECGGEE